ncbi:MAG: hypothetical protein JO290_03765 [Sphingomonadaceae bacterium]|nr:hypothetical protein [Sphingomonadaceae bacterium]
MTKPSRPLRAVLILGLVMVVAGCSSARQALGAYKREADKGITIGGGRPGEGFAPPGSASGETTPAPERTRTADAKTPKEALPGGLGGDKQHPAYTDAPQ